MARTVWRQEQLAYINTVCEGAERKAALCGLMEQEAELIASIGQHKIQADSRNNEKGMMQFLNKVRYVVPPTHSMYGGKCVNVVGVCGHHKECRCGLEVRDHSCNQTTFLCTTLGCKFLFDFFQGHDRIRCRCKKNK